MIVKRYMVFAGESYYPGGGMIDFKGSFSSLDEAVQIMSKEAKKSGPHTCWGHIYDNSKNKIVKEYSIENYKGKS